jgi:hypothetical protein
MKTRSFYAVATLLGGALFLTSHAQNAGGAAAGGVGAAGTAGAAAGAGTAAGPGSATGTAPATGLPVGPTTNAGTPIPGNLDPSMNPSLSGNASSTANGTGAAQGNGSLISVPSSQIPTTAPGTAPIGPQPPLSTTGVTGGASVGTDTQASSTTTPGTTTLPATENAFPNSVGAPPAVIVNSPPPPARTETMTPAPGSNQTWVPGHYSWLNGQWTWVSGQWATPPQRGLMWVPGQFDPGSRHWVEGHWESNSAPNPLH